MQLCTGRAKGHDSHTGKRNMLVMGDEGKRWCLLTSLRSWRYCPCRLELLVGYECMVLDTQGFWNGRSPITSLVN